MEHEAFTNESYQQQRQKWLGIIPKSAFLSAVGRNAWMLNFTLAGAAVAAIVSGVLTIPVWGVVALIGGAVAAAGLNLYATYADEKMSKTVDMSFREAQHTANAKVTAKELAVALKEAFRDEPAAAQAVKARLMQPREKWEERVHMPEESVSQSIN